MPLARVLMLSLHTSPLAQPGTGDGGGMNVYVRSLAEALARSGVDCDVLTRAEHAEQPPVSVLERGVRVVHLDAGPRRPVPKVELPALVPELVAAARDHVVDAGESYDAIHTNYWISGAVGHALKHELDLPLVATFHTLGRVKSAAGIDDDDAGRTAAELDVVRCADRVIVSTPEEHATLCTHYDADPERVEIVTPGVDHARFGPGDRRAARRALGLALDGPILLFVGRLQPLKGADLALGCLAELPEPRARLVVVGGPSGPDGPAEVTRLHELADDLGIGDRVHWVDPVPHERLGTWYQAADVCLVPSRAESFGLVALEAAASGTPVVASDVGGLRTIVDHGETGLLVADRDPGAFAAAVQRALGEAGAAMGRRSVARAERHTWSLAAARLRRLYGDVAACVPVQCR